MSLNTLCAVTAYTPVHACRFPPDSFGWAEPHITIVFQGSEQVITEHGEILDCGACQSRVIGTELFGTGCVASASPDNPFLTVSLRLDQRLVAYLASTIPPHLRAGHDILKDASVARADPDILDAFFRLAGLLENPVCIPHITPLIVWEIHYRLLIGPHDEECGIPLNTVIH